MTPAVAERPMTREAALIDAAMTVQRMQRRERRRLGTVDMGKTARIRNHVANALRCPQTWFAIQGEIVLRLLAEDVSLQRAA